MIVPCPEIAYIFEEGVIILCNCEDVAQRVYYGAQNVLEEEDEGGCSVQGLAVLVQYVKKT